MASVWEDRFSGWLGRVLSLRESTALEVLPDLMPVIPVLDPRAPELRRLRGERLFFEGVTMVAAGGQLPTVECGLSAAASNPDCLLIIEGALFSSAVPQIVEWNIIGPGAAVQNPVPIPPLDTRDPSLLCATVGGVAAAGSIATGRRFNLGADRPLLVPLNFVFPRGWKAAFQGQVLAATLTVNFFGYERSGVSQSEQR